MSKEELQSLFGKQRCKPEPVEPCKNSTFGCCPDGFNSAEGPFNAGCDEVKTCENTKYGCCRDGASLASGMKVIQYCLFYHSHLTTVCQHFRVDSQVTFKRRNNNLASRACHFKDYVIHSYPLTRISVVYCSRITVQCSCRLSSGF